MKTAPVLVVPALLSCMAGPAAAQSAPAWPAKPVRFVAPFPPDGVDWEGAPEPGGPTRSERSSSTHAGYTDQPTSETGETAR